MNEGRGRGFGEENTVCIVLQYQTTASVAKEGVATAFSVSTRQRSAGTLNEGDEGGLGGGAPIET